MVIGIHYSMNYHLNWEKMWFNQLMDRSFKESNSSKTKNLSFWLTWSQNLKWWTSLTMISSTAKEIKLKNYSLCSKEVLFFMLTLWMSLTWRILSNMIAALMFPLPSTVVVHTLEITTHSCRKMGIDLTLQFANKIVKYTQLKILHFLKALRSSTASKILCLRSQKRNKSTTFVWMRSSKRSTSQSVTLKIFTWTKRTTNGHFICLWKDKWLRKTMLNKEELQNYSQEVKEGWKSVN